MTRAERTVLNLCLTHVLMRSRLVTTIKEMTAEAKVLVAWVLVDVHKERLTVRLIVQDIGCDFSFQGIKFTLVM